MLEHLFFGCLLEWVYGKLPMQELEIRVQYGFALTMLGVANTDAAVLLRARALSAQQSLWQTWQRAANENAISSPPSPAHARAG